MDNFEAIMYVYERLKPPQDEIFELKKKLKS